MARITVDFEKQTAPIKIMHAVNNGPLSPGQSDQIRTNFEDYKAARIPYARNHDAAFYSGYGGEHTVDIGNVFPDFNADENDPASYDFPCTDKYVEGTYMAGTEMFYRLGAKIEHEIKKYGTLPPPDFHKWARICEHIIRHYTEGWADGFTYKMTYWEIWNEPDLDPEDSDNKRTWGGTKAQFFDLYEITAKHLKSCFPHLKIGGPAIAGVGRYAYAREFLHAMKERDVPIDFFSWHFYYYRPAIVDLCANLVHEMLVESGYGDAESICNEWNYIQGWTDRFVYSIRQIISLKGSSFVSSVMMKGQRVPVDMLMYYDARPSVYNGLFDYYTCDKLKGYYPFVMWSKLRELGTEVSLTCDDPEIDAVAAIGKDGKAAIMMTYFTDNDLLTATKHVDFSLSGLNIEKITAYPVTSDKNAEPQYVSVSDSFPLDLSFDMAPNNTYFILINGNSLYAE